VLASDSPVRNGEAGFTLPVALWTLVLVSLFAVAYMATARTSIRIAGNSAVNAEAAALAEAGISAAILDLIEARRTQGRSRRIPPDGRPVSCRLPAGETVEIRIEDEARKLDLNEADEAQLIALLTGLGHSRSEASSIASRIADYRDADGLRRLNGAEAEEYAAAGRADGPANAPFAAVEQLASVLGLPEAVYRQIQRLVTVYSEGAGAVFTVHSSVRPRRGGEASLAAIVALPLKRSRAYEVRRWLGRGAAQVPSGSAEQLGFAVPDIGPC
jgi:general secretion pathway protein K